MARHTILWDWKSEFYQNDYTIQSNLKLQCNPYQITKDIFHRTQTKYVKVCLEAQKTQNSQRHPEKEKWSWRNKAPGLQTILQNYSHQNCMVLAQDRNIDQLNRTESPELNPRT